MTRHRRKRFGYNVGNRPLEPGRGKRNVPPHVDGEEERLFELSERTSWDFVSNQYIWMRL